MKENKLPFLSKHHKKKHLCWMKNYMKTDFKTLCRDGRIAYLYVVNSSGEMEKLLCKKHRVKRNIKF